MSTSPMGFAQCLLRSVRSALPPAQATDAATPEEKQWQVVCDDWLRTGGPVGTGSCCRQDDDIFLGWCQKDEAKESPLFAAACDPTSPGDEAQEGPFVATICSGMTAPCGTGRIRDGVRSGSLHPAQFLRRQIAARRIAAMAGRLHAYACDSWPRSGDRRCWLDSAEFGSKRLRMSDGVLVEDVSYDDDLSGHRGFCDVLGYHQREWLAGVMRSSSADLMLGE